MKLQNVWINICDHSDYKYMNAIHKTIILIIFRARKCLTGVSSMSPGIIHLVAVLASTLPWSFFIQVRRLSGVPWRRLSPPSFVRVSPSLFTAIPTSSSAHKPDLVPACLCLAVSVLPALPSCLSKTFCQLWKLACVIKHPSATNCPLWSLTLFSLGGMILRPVTGPYSGFVLYLPVFSLCLGNPHYHPRITLKASLLSHGSLNTLGR